MKHWLHFARRALLCFQENLRILRSLVFGLIFRSSDLQGIVTLVTPSELEECFCDG